MQEIGTILVATLNSGKVKEIQSFLSTTSFRAIGLDKITGLQPCLEDGGTFEANARKKAEYYSRFTKTPTVTDDSGLEVDALGGLPGVFSARFVSETATDEQRYRAVLARMQEAPEARRSARFICILALASHGKVLQVFNGVVEGKIAWQPRGTGGFGYDPIFLIPESDKTLAELSIEQKQRISHRGKALQKLGVFLSNSVPDLSV